jgi:hypothetical protein
MAVEDGYFIGRQGAPREIVQQLAEIDQAESTMTAALTAPGA